MVFENGVKNIQAADYIGARTVVTKFGTPTYQLLSVSIILINLQILSNCGIMHAFVKIIFQGESKISSNIQ